MYDDTDFCLEIAPITRVMAKKPWVPLWQYVTV